MTRQEMMDLSGAEVTARLCNRGMAPTQARRLVNERDRSRLAIDEIMRVLNDKGRL